MKIEILRTAPKDLDEILKRASNKIPVDRATVKACLDRSAIAWTGTADGKVACIYGLVTPSVLGDRAYLWLLTTDIVDQHPFIFVRHSQMVVREMLKEYPVIWGNVLEENDQSIKWLKWLGMKVVNRKNNVLAFELRAS